MRAAFIGVLVLLAVACSAALAGDGFERIGA